MTSRSDLDTSATVIAAIVGVAIILVALPFTIAAFPQTPKSYDAAWGERELDAKALTIPADTGTYTASVSASDFQPASIRVETSVCQDNANANLQQQGATIHLKLTQTHAGASKVLKEIPDMHCPGESFTIKLGDHADVAGSQANDASTAKRIVWLDASAQNTTGLSLYTLEVTPSRVASPIPALPVAPAPTLGASLRLSLFGWDVAMNEHQKEASR